MVDKVVKLSRAYEVPGEVPFDSVTLREPTYADIFMSGLGRPQELQPNGQGGSMLVTYTVTVDAYLQRLAIAPGYSALSHLSASDAMALERAVCGFFLSQAATSETPNSPPAS